LAGWRTCVADPIIRSIPVRLRQVEAARRRRTARSARQWSCFASRIIEEQHNSSKYRDTGKLRGIAGVFALYQLKADCRKYR